MSTKGLVLAAGASAASATATLLRRPLSSCSLNKVPSVLPRGHSLQPKKDDEISVVSYNVLCEKFATSSQFSHVPPSFLEFDYRWHILQKELAEFESDIICLQESTIERWSEMKEFMQGIGYECIQQIKPHEVKLAMFYRASRVNLQWWEERSRALLAEIQLGLKTVYVVNVHLEGSPRRADDRVAQLRHALHRLRYRIETTTRGDLDESIQSASVICCGDFNSLRNEAPCIFLEEGHLPAGYRDGPEHIVVTKDDIHHDFAFRDVYSSPHFTPPFTRKVDGRGAQLDFLWCSRIMGVSAILRPMPSDPEVEKMVCDVGLPNARMPSDHLPIGAVLRLP